MIEFNAGDPPFVKAVRASVVGFPAAVEARYSKRWASSLCSEPNVNR